MVEACVRAGKLEGVASVARQALWHVRSTLQRPPARYGWGPRWSCDQAAEGLTQVTLKPEEDPPRPQVSSLHFRQGTWGCMQR